LYSCGCAKGIQVPQTLFGTIEEAASLIKAPLVHEHEVNP